MIVAQTPIVPTLQRRNAVGDAPRHRSAPRRAIKIGRGASVRDSTSFA
ncbi:hypothetical protein PSPTOT1_5165 [Pseudomonas syringae pv. tomato T1]|nr:hypothetical protein PSPTOT1_5165 [Pseudomonas syringae pv. tomato T1]